MKPNKAKDRWKILRNAIVTNNKSPPQANPASIHSFPGFSLLPKEQIIYNDTIEDIMYWNKLCTISVEIEQEFNVKIVIDKIKECIDNCIDGISCLLNKERIVIIRLIFYTKNATKEELKERIQNTVLNDIQQWCKVAYNDMNDTSQDKNVLYNLSIPIKPTNYNCYEYTIQTIKIRTRERTSTKPSLKELSSEIHNNGIDNTGNICLWDCSITLTYLLFHNDIFKFNNIYSFFVDKMKVSRVRCIELGCGMVALPSFTLYHVNNDLPMDITITDGHENSVRNNKINLLLQQQQQEKTSNRINYKQLKWDKSQQGYKDCQSLTTNGKYHLSIVSDCLHFTKYHLDLLYTISRLLEVNGICILCQPQRGNSMKLFLNLVNDNEYYNGLYDVSVYYNGYEERITALHETFLKDSSYVPDVHYPTVIVMKKLREWCE